MNARLLTSSFLLLTLTVVAQPTPRPIEVHIRTLAADSMEGRGLGTDGIDKSADYIESQLRAAKLKPPFDSSYRQPFPVKMGVSLGGKSAIAGLTANDWTPLPFSSPGAFSGPLAFVGYGIDAPPLGYREFEGIDLKGKVALMLRYEPQERDEHSVFDGRKPSRWSALRYKVLQARERGAVAVVFVTGPLQDEGKDKLPPLTNDGPESAAGIPVLQVKTSVAQKWIDLATFQAEVDKDLHPRSRVLDTTLAGNVDINASFVETRNVAGLIPGRGALANEVVVLGAHYDHLGYGGHGSLEPNVHAIHNGADDNASGTAAVLVAAQRLQQLLKDAPSRRTVAIVLFSAEEVGLGGSSYFVVHPPFPRERVVAMLNLDMVGAMHDDRVIAFGTESAAEWKPILDREAAALKLNMTESGDGYGPSDQTSFYARQIPVLHFFTGTHERYHTSRDDADFVNFAGAERVAELTARIAAALARGEVTPHYARASAAPAMEGDSRGYGAYLGTIPDYSAMDATAGGVKLADVRAGGPADKAGLKGGDVIVNIGGTRIENLYDMTFALQDRKPGDTVDVIVLRAGARVTLRATLGSRGAAVPASQGAHGAAAPPLAIGAGKPFDKTFDGEKHLKDVRQLTFGGENAEAYFSPDGTKLIYQATAERGGCDQEYVVDLKSGETKRVSSGEGKTTCGFFFYPSGDRVLYSSTHAAGAACPPKPDRSLGYTWALDEFDIYSAKPDGSDRRPLIVNPGYDAETTMAFDGSRMVFTSTRDGDIDLYTAKMDGSDVHRITSTPGYDGGATFSPDGGRLVWRASRPTGAELDDYRALLAKHLVRP
ncbi:MAG: putative aminopeptidase, partial [Acidobacteria bacterium]|nr:putative aminopeptidase [Acidobacteriota bacterium]